MTIFGVTGTSRLLSLPEKDYVHRIIKRTVLANRRNNRLVSGCAFGVDTEAILAVWGLIPFENVICIVPGTAQHNYGLVEQCTRAGATIIKSPTLHTVGKTYLHRNKVVVEQARTLLAFPIYKTFYRSGTWHTINQARKANLRVRIYPLSKAEHNSQ